MLAFSPESPIERAFVQSFNWPLDRLWHQADRNGDIGNWDSFSDKLLPSAITTQWHDTQDMSTRSQAR